MSATVPRSVGAMHPLCALDGEHDDLGGCVAGIDGERPARDTAIRIAHELSMHPMVIAPNHKPLYHAAAVTVAGHAVALFGQAIEMLNACNIDESMARQALLPLMRGAIRKLESQSPERAMTGPVPRGDACTIERHLEALTSLPDDTRQTYYRLANTSLRLVGHSLVEDSVIEIKQVLEGEN